MIRKEGEMFKGIKMKKQYENLIGCYLLSFGAMAIVDYILGLKLPISLLFLMTMVIHILLYLLDYYRKQVIVYVGITIMFFLIYAMCRFFNWEVLKTIHEAYEWLRSYDQSEENYKFLFAMINGTSFMLGISTVLYIINRFEKVKLILAFSNLAVLLGMCFMGITAAKTGVTCFIAYDFMILTKHMHLKQYGKGKTETWKVVISLSPICLAIGVIATLLPSKEEPISWRWVFNLYYNSVELCQDIAAEIAFKWGGVSDEFGLSFEGVDGKNTLDGNIGTGNQEMLSVVMRSMPHQTLYLAGIYKDTYSENNWKCLYNQQSSDLEEYRLSTYEMILSMYEGELEAGGENLYAENAATVKYGKIRTRTLFLPINTEAINELDKEHMPTFTTATVRYPKRQKEGQYYKTEFLEINRENSYIKERLHQLENTTYDEELELDKEKIYDKLGETVNEHVLKEMLEEKNLFSKLKKRQEKIQEVYTVLPKDLPERVRNLTEELTQSCESRYDKLKAIEQYLKQYHYTKTPGKVPAGHDFVDYFLFDGKEGYCTYFASSMAIMARTIGIPTRYVEGFIVDECKSERGREYTVRADKAHAWVEAYFDGFGWVRFEPSAGYELSQYQSWAIVNDKPKGYVTMPEIPIPEIATMTDSSVDLAAMISEQDYQEEQERARKFRQIVVGVLIVSILAIIGMSSFQILRYRILYYRAQMEKQYRMKFKEMMYLLGKLGYQLQENETLLQFLQRVQHEKDSVGTYAEKMIMAYSKARYGSKVISKEQVSQLQAFYEELFETLCNQYGKPKSIWWKITYQIWGYK